MLDFLKLIAVRFVAAYLVLVGKAIPVYISKSSDTTILVVETEGSEPVYVSCRNLVQDDSSYNILLGKILLWITTQNRFFWTSNNLGNQVKALAEESFDKHKNPNNLL